MSSSECYFPRPFLLNINHLVMQKDDHLFAINVILESIRMSLEVNAGRTLRKVMIGRSPINTYWFAFIIDPNCRFPMRHRLIWVCHPFSRFSPMPFVQCRVKWSMVAITHLAHICISQLTRHSHRREASVAIQTPKSLVVLKELSIALLNTIE